MNPKQDDPAKILVVTTYFYPQPGGVANHTYNLYQRLANNYGYAVTVIASSTRKSEYQVEDLDGMKVYRLPYWFKLSNTPINPKWLFTMKKIIRQEQPHVICSHTPVPFMADIAALVKGDTPLVTKYHHAGSMKKGKLFTDVPIQLYESLWLHFILDQSVTLISASEHTRRSFLQRYANKSVTITPAVDLNRFRNRRTRNQPNLLFVANLNKAERYKGLAYLLQAFPLIIDAIPEVTLSIVGTGDDLVFYHQLTNDLGIDEHVQFKGRLQGPELAEVYQQSSILVLPSLFESCPNVLLEAMAAGLPIVGSNTAGIPDLIEDGHNGYLFAPRDSNDLARVVIKILSDPVLAKTMGSNGLRKVATEYTWDQIVQQTNSVIKQAMHPS